MKLYASFSPCTLWCQEEKKCQFRSIRWITNLMIFRLEEWCGLSTSREKSYRPVRREWCWNAVCEVLSWKSHAFYPSRMMLESINHHKTWSTLSEQVVANFQGFQRNRPFHMVKRRFKTPIRLRVREVLDVQENDHDGYSSNSRRVQWITSRNLLLRRIKKVFILLVIFIFAARLNRQFLILTNKVSESCLSVFSLLVYSSVFSTLFLFCTLLLCIFHILYFSYRALLKQALVGCLV